MALSAIDCSTAQEAIDGADLVISSVMFSPQLKPFIDARWLKPGAFATLTDLATSWYPDNLSVFDHIIIDDLHQETKMQKPLVDPGLVSGDLTSLLSGDFTGRRDESKRMAFAFRGLALGDLAVSALAFQQACSMSKGTQIEI